MPAPERSPVLDSPFPPDDYLCTWHLPGPDNTTVHLSGMVELRESLIPYGRIYGDLPLVGITTDNETAMSFPQVHEHAAVRATLANGAELIVLNAQVTYWPGHGSVRGAAAAVRKHGNVFPMSTSNPPEAEPDETVTFTRMRLQVGALDAILGATPIGYKTSPRRQADDGTWTWSAKTSSATPITWTGTNDELVGAYAAEVNTGDFYNVSIRFAPVLNAAMPPLTLFDVVRRYVDPIRAIASIATGKSQPITHLMLSRTHEPTHRTAPHASGSDSDTNDPSPFELMPAWQIYGTGLRQAPYQSDSETVRNHKSVLFCGDDGVDLLELVHAWWKLADEHHPLIETYAGMLHAQEEHPRSRFLLLIQSLEGMYGHETKADYATQKATHQELRTETLKRIGKQVERDDFQFIKNSLAKEPFRSLETALRWSFKIHAPEPLIPDRLARTRLLKLVALEEACSTLDALRRVRNDLAHGTRGFDARDLDEVNDILDSVVRAHALRLLGCPDLVLGRLFD
ncbi:MAG: hypothetical protein ACRCYU_24040 [Nocardioides sp.]